MQEGRIREADILENRTCGLSSTCFHQSGESLLQIKEHCIFQQRDGAVKVKHRYVWGEKLGGKNYFHLRVKIEKSGKSVNRSLMDFFFRANAAREPNSYSNDCTGEQLHFSPCYFSNLNNSPIHFYLFCKTKRIDTQHVCPPPVFRDIMFKK